MSSQASEVFLQQMYELIRRGHRHFVRRDRSGKNSIQQLADLGLTGFDEAWDCILTLNKSHYFSGPEYDHLDTSRSEGRVVWVFKIEINGIMAYIKLKEDKFGPRCKCMAFHEDEP